MTFTSVTTHKAVYYVTGKSRLHFDFYAQGTVGGTPNTNLEVTMPVNRNDAIDSYLAGGGWNNNAAVEGSFALWNGTSQSEIAVRRPASANWSAGTAYIGIMGEYTF